MTLSELGWTPFFAQAFEQQAHAGLTPARIVRHDRQRYLARTEAGVYTALMLGRMQADEAAQRPAVGDWVAVEVFDDDQAIIHAVLPRRSAFSRKQAGGLTREQVIAANIDTVFLVSGLDHDFNLRRIERYVVQAAGSGARPVIVLNKADVCPDVTEHRQAVEQIAAGVDVLAVSAQAGTGLEALRTYVRSGQTVAFLGSSGVGKSTLVNHLLGDHRQATQAVRIDDSRGRHTTTHRELLVVPGGGLVIDTPGLRELQLWGEEADLHAAFADIAALAEACRFRDCTHEVEPGCAVQAALEEGDLDAGRWQSYSKLRRELQYLESRQEEAGRYQQKRRDKQFGRLRSQINRHNPKR